jgi:hypothetical protein
LPFLSLLWLALQVASPAVRIEEAPGALRVHLDWPAPVAVSSSSEGRELLVRFDRRLDVASPADLAKQAPAWIESVSMGFDTMLVRAARDVTFRVTSAGQTTTIELAPVMAAEAEPPADQEGERRLELLRAQLLVNEGRLGAAEAALSRFVGQHPTSVPGLVTLAQVEMQRGRWRAAERRLNDALGLDPANEDVAVTLDDIRGAQGSRIRTDVEIKHVDSGQEEESARLSGHARVTRTVRVGVGLEGRRLTYLNRRTERDRGEAFLQADFERGSMLRLSGFGGEGIGGGLSFAHPDAAGRTLAQIEYRRVYWEFVESIVGNGTRDRAEIRREQPLGSRFNLRGAAAANRYGLGGVADVARSLAAEAGATALLWPRNPSIGIDYALDAESVRSLTPGTLPLVSREVHALGATTFVRFSRRLTGDAFAGYAWDRLGGRGPFTGGRLTYGGPSRLGLEVWIDRRLNAVTTTERVTRAGAYLAWRAF